MGPYLQLIGAYLVNPMYYDLWKNLDELCLQSHLAFGPWPTIALEESNAMTWRDGERVKFSQVMSVTTSCYQMCQLVDQVLILGMVNQPLMGNP